ncbi:hypothetical protein MMC25_002173 [Agyrium rufum]|nr:hypothetical protein [Agyrium rufum]
MMYASVRNYEYEVAQAEDLARTERDNASRPGLPRQYLVHVNFDERGLLFKQQLTDEARAKLFFTSPRYMKEDTRRNFGWNIFLLPETPEKADMALVITRPRSCRRVFHYISASAIEPEMEGIEVHILIAVSKKVVNMRLKGLAYLWDTAINYDNMSTLRRFVLGNENSPNDEAHGPHQDPKLGCAMRHKKIYSGMDEPQQTAVERITSSRYFFTCTEGLLPGVGKSKVVIAATRIFMTRGLKVLVLAPSNSSVNYLLNQLLIVEPSAQALRYATESYDDEKFLKEIMKPRSGMTGRNAYWNHSLETET